MVFAIEIFVTWSFEITFRGWTSTYSFQDINALLGKNIYLHYNNEQ